MRYRIFAALQMRLVATFSLGPLEITTIAIKRLSRANLRSSLQATPACQSRSQLSPQSAADPIDHSSGTAPVAMWCCSPYGTSRRIANVPSTTQNLRYSGSTVSDDVGGEDWLPTSFYQACTMCACGRGFGSRRMGHNIQPHIMLPGLLLHFS